MIINRLAGLLTHSYQPAEPSQQSQWHILQVPHKGQEITAAGTVADSHDIPF